MNNLAIDEIKEIANECLNVVGSFAYFLANYAYIENKEDKRPMLFTLWPSQLRILPQIIKSKLLMILKARQLGLTWLCAAYVLWYAMTKPMKLVVVISAKGEWAIEFMDRIYFILRLLPEWLYPPVDKETTEVLRFEHKNQLFSTIKSLTTTEAGAQSKTPDILILDETCWNPYIRSIYNASKPGIDAADGRIIIISNSIKTAPGWGWTRDLFVKAWKGLNDFDWLFMPWWDRPGRPKNFRGLQEAGGMDEQEVVEHYPETVDEAISALTGSYFGKTLARHNQTATGLIGTLRKTREKEIEFAQAKKGILEVWRFPYHLVSGWDEVPWTKRYCIGSDVSEGLGQSYSVAYVYDRLLQELIARIRSNRIDAHTWADLLWQLSQYYCFGRPAGDWYEKENALICVETTGSGQTTVQCLQELGANLYMQQTAPKAGSELTKRFGWHESNQAKHDLSEDLRNWFKHTKGRVYDPILIEECGTWILHEGGRIGPEDETKLGDCVIGAGLAIQADYFMEGKPKQIEPPLAGWQARFKEGKGSAWTG